MSEDRLIGWLCFIRWQFEQGDHGANAPCDVVNALEAKGWAKRAEEANWDGSHQLAITSAGYATADLAAPEWGIDPIPEDSEC